MHDKDLCELREVYVLGGLTADEQKAYELHLSKCAECQVEVERMRQDAEKLLYDFELVDPPVGMSERVLGAIFAEAPAGGETGEGGDDRANGRDNRGANRGDIAPEEGTPGADNDSQVWATSGPQTRRQKQNVRRLGRPWLPWASAAAAFVVVSAGTIWWANSRVQSGSPSPIGTVTDTVTLQTKAGSGTAKMWVTATQAQSQMLIHFADLAPTSGSQVYQVWLLPPNGNPVSAGVFRPDASGKAVFASLMPQGKYAAVAVTLEPKAIDAKPLGKMVFQAKL